MAMEETWTRGYHLIMGAYQMEQWLNAYLKASGTDVEDTEVSEDRQIMQVLRNAIEHLSDARLGEAVARKDAANTKWKNPSIDKLPGGALFLGFGPGDHEYVFGLVEVKWLFDAAKRYAHVDTPPEMLDFEPSDIDFENMQYGYDDGS
ncbi:hypothetical protein [Paractinoplanes maris]|uniref:hypothetical protein n=1 Tax=Paractinoplanes maris TaxID=1734446 RepID=UPI0020207721|nr:hypothetical protein [Actinoplanes maris]